MNIRQCTTLEELSNELESLENLTASQAIKAKCYECSAFQISEANGCTISDCPLYIYRIKRSLKKQEKQETK